MQIANYSRRLGSTIGFASLLIAQVSMVRAAEPATGGTLELEEIVVTATKRPEKLQEVPISVAVTSQAEMQSQNLTQTDDLKRLVPGLEFRHAGSPGNNGFGIRGITTLGASYGLEQSAGVAFDGVPLARPVGAIADLVDIQHVETLKGPQGMLFGKNASAGLINIISNSPELGKDETNFRVAFGTLNSQQYSGTTNLAITDDSAVRITAWKFQHDGVINEVNTGQDMGNQNSGGVRFKYRWKATDNLDLNFTGEWNSHDENGTAYSIRSFNTAFYNPQNAGQAVEDFERAQGTVPSDTNRTARGLNNAYYDKGHTNAYTGQADYAIGDGKLITIVSYRDIKGANSFDPFPTASPANNSPKNTDWIGYSQTSEEVRYESPVEDRFHYTVGLFNFRLNLHDNIGFGVSGPFGPFVDINVLEDMHNDSYAAFGEATFDITKELHVFAGLRRTTDKLKESMYRSGPCDPYDNPIGPCLSGTFSAATSTSYNDLSWRTGLQYQFLPEAMAYATVSRGYKGPGIGYDLDTTNNTLAVSNNGVVKPEIVHAYEVGIKSQWFNRRVNLNLAVYDEIFDDFQTSLITPSTPFNLTTYYNAGQMVTKGVDLSLGWLVTSSFSLFANVGYTDAKFTDFKGAACYSGQTAAQGCISGIQDLSDKPLANTPKNTANLTARYEHPITSELNGYFQANGSYRSSVNFSTNGDPLTRFGGYTLLNLNAGINDADGRWGVSVYGNNVLNKHYVDGIYANGSGDSVLFNDLGYQDLRTYGVAVNARF